MILIPLQTSPTKYTIYIGLDETGVQRIKEYDPAVVPLGELPPQWRTLTLTEVVITYTTEEDLIKIQELCDKGAVKEALRHLCRGFKYRPDLGDHDGPPLSMRVDPKDTKQ